jgi:hypothetical protein
MNHDDHPQSLSVLFDSNDDLSQFAPISEKRCKGLSDYSLRISLLLSINDIMMCPA